MEFEIKKTINLDYKGVGEIIFNPDAVSITLATTHNPVTQTLTVQLDIINQAREVVHAYAVKSFTPKGTPVQSNTREVEKAIKDQQKEIQKIETLRSEITQLQNSGDTKNLSNKLNKLKERQAILDAILVPPPTYDIVDTYDQIIEYFNFEGVTELGKQFFKEQFPEIFRSIDFREKK